MDANSLKPDELPCLTIDTLGRPMFDSPFLHTGHRFINDNEKIQLYCHSESLKYYKGSGEEIPMLEMAGARKKIFFEPKK